ncbi:MAG: hypothetical protein HUU16_01525 [Candidatus Omnitrophica bacterium]|nr:hypothetical protein [Candidatus Omnitrophota bacterium]
MRKRIFVRGLFVLSIGALCLFGVTPSPAATYFSESFDSYSDNSGMFSAGWVSRNFQELFDNGDVQGTNGQPHNEGAKWGLKGDPQFPQGGRINPPDRNGGTTGGKYIISDSDNAPSSDGGNPDAGYAITSPAFNCSSAAGSVYLHCSIGAILNDNDTAVFEVYVSGNNGATWNLVLQRVSPGSPLSTTANADGIHGVVDIDITAHAAGNAQVKVRFTSRANSDGWWVTVDDIVVDDINYGFNNATTLFGPEGFAGAADTIPAGWARTTAHGAGNQWQVGYLNRHTTVVAGIIGQSINRLDTTYATFESGEDGFGVTGDGADNETLTTPTINCGSFNQIFLHFDSEIAPKNEVANVLVSIDNGTTFDPAPVWTYNNYGDNDEDSTYTHHVVPVALAANQAQVKFRFLFQTAGDELYWAVDNVLVTGRNGDTAPDAPTISHANPTFTLNQAVSSQGLTGFNTTAYSTSGTGTHGRTDWQVLRVGGTTPVASGSTTTGDLTAIRINGVESPGNYVVRARHVSLQDQVAGLYGPDLAFTVGGPQFTVQRYCEDFDSLAGSLLPAASEAVGQCAGGIADLFLLGWTHTPPAGWNVDNSELRTNNGTLEWYGWSFTTLEFWTDADDQDRSAFTKSLNVLAVADADEYDDCNGAAGGDNVIDAAYYTTLSSPPIAIPANEPILITFDSHYRQENPQQAEVTVSFDGGPTQQILYYCCEGDPVTGDNAGVDVQNAGIVLNVPAQPANSNMVVNWRYFTASNDWFWAIDNFCVYSEVGPGEGSSVDDWNLYE